MTNERKLTTLDIAYMGMFIALITICSWISIPLTVPITLQTFAIFATVAILRTKKATITVIIYILLGAFGCPVFTGFKGGFAALLGTTGGYIVGFVLAAIISGKIIDVFGKKIWIMFLAMILGLLVCYAFGTAWFIFVYTKANGAVSVATALSWCVIPFIIPDIVKIALAILLEKRVGKYVRVK